ncbi:unnamed protein product [Hermetia illucens]|uniref:Uncharacterized protein n=1 Tax=Hermetia illucens TaxID=343691 RepID=A0A7R8YP99_HERIL|nr:unnamed protein product [Hermetia illucens]
MFCKLVCLYNQLKKDTSVNGDWRWWQWLWPVAKQLKPYFCIVVEVIAMLKEQQIFSDLEKKFVIVFNHGCGAHVLYSRSSSRTGLQAVLDVL